MQAIRVEESSSGSPRFRAAAGFRLSALDGERLSTEATVQAKLSQLFNARQRNVRLCQILGTLTMPITLEIHMVARQTGPETEQIHTGVLLWVAANQREAAVRDCTSASDTLKSAFDLCWPHAELVAVNKQEELSTRFRPFKPESCLWVRRRYADVPLLRPLEWHMQPIGFRAVGGFAGVSNVTIPHVFPWIPREDDWCALLDALLLETEERWIIFRASNYADSQSAIQRLETNVQSCEEFLAAPSATHTALTSQIRVFREVCLRQARALAGGALRGSVLLLSPGSPSEFLGVVVGQAISADLTDDTEDCLFQGGFHQETVHAHSVLDPFAVSEPEPFSYEEASCFFRLPHIFDDKDHGLPLRRNRLIPAQLPYPSPLHHPLTELGVSYHRHVANPVSVALDHRYKHTFIIGMTGTGKTTLMLRMLLQDLRAGHGVCLIDPHGDLADGVLARFPDERVEDLMVVDFGEREYPVPMNLLSFQTIEERDLIIDDLLSALLRVYRDPEMFGPIFETNFRGMLKLLMGDQHGGHEQFTLLEFPLLYQRHSFRKYLLEKSRDRQVHAFVSELERISSGDYKLENLAPYITSKLARFLHDTLLRRVVGHGGMHLDFQRTIDERKVVIVKLGRGRFGERVCDLILSQIVSRFRLAAMRRANIPKPQRLPFFLYVDEFGVLASDENFSQLMSEARKYRLGLVLATQYAAQLREPDLYHRNVLSAVLGNAGTLIAFRVGLEDARMLEPLFAPSIAALDLMECPNFQGYMRLHLNEITTRPFSFQNSLDPTQADEDNAQRLITLSRTKWGVPAAECDEHAEQRRLMISQLRA